MAFRTIDEATKRGALAVDARIGRLHGLVMDRVGLREWDERAVGMLLTYIEPRRCAYSVLCYLADDEHSHKHLGRWTADLSDNVGSLHRAGCIWRDDKPENVLVGKEDEGWIIDFGLLGARGGPWYTKERLAGHGENTAVA